MKKSGAYQTFLKSYLIMLILPILVSVFGYLYSNKMIEEEVLEYQTTIIKKTQGIGDQIISNHMLSKGALLSNKSLKNLMGSTEWSGSLMFDIVELKDVITGMKNSNYLMEDVQVYFPQSGDLITTKRRYPERLTYIYADEANLPCDYEDIFNFSVARGYFVQDSGTEDCRIYFYENTFSRNYKDVLASIVTVLKWKDVEEILGDMGSNSRGTIFLIDKNGNIIGNSNMSVDISGFEYAALTDAGELMRTVIDGEKYVSSFMGSNVIDLKYVICVPESVFYKKNNYMLLAILIELMICMVIGVMLAAYLAKKNSNPIERLMAKLNSSKRGAGVAEGKMATDLGVALSNLANDYENMEKQLEYHNKILNEKMLFSILNGRKQTGKISADFRENMNRRMESEWGNDPYRIIAIGYINPEESIFGNDGKSFTSQDISLSFFVIENVLQETFLSEGWGLVLETDNVVLAIVKDDPEIFSKLQNCVGFFEEIFKLDVYVAISKPHHGVDELSESYAEALATVGYKCFWEDEVDDIVFYEENSDDDIPFDIGKYADDIKKLNNCVATRDYCVAKTLLGNMLDEGFKKDIKNMSINHCQASGIISLVLGIISGIHTDDGDDIIKNLDVSGRLLKAQSINQLKNEIDLIFDEIISGCEDLVENKIPQKILDAKDYIDKNYADVNLSISSVADEFGISLSYMGRMFKKYTGNGILGYLHMVRVSKCKELLDEGKSVKDAALLSGFIDSKSMIRTFRKYEGITPGQYKKCK
ncbi:MAG: helix-turn-helix domain-containing protein [Acetatifactor sp.]|nr:helix-turn-helix domain-containing protein [Acetatifactor sp.]